MRAIWDSRELVLPSRICPMASRVGLRKTLFAALLLNCAAALIFLSGCATSTKIPTASTRSFDFKKETFSFSNQLVWIYGYDANGKWTSHRRDPKPDYTQHCFLLSRATVQFYQNATFNPLQPVTNKTTYAKLVRQVFSSNPRKTAAPVERIVIPGYEDLRSFSTANEKLLKSASGSGWRSYFQRGHWRMVFPFTREQQERTAEEFLKKLSPGPPFVVHLVKFPQLTINHAVVLYAAKEENGQIQFMTYDTNNCEEPTVLTFDRATKTFLFPANEYFCGGEVDVYQVYHKWDY